MNMSRTSTSVLSVAALTGLCIGLWISPAQAQNAPTFYNMNKTIIDQMAAVPEIYKQITVLVGVLTTYVGLHGFYKGAADPRSAAHLKNFFLLLVGGMFLALSFLALSAEKSVFGTNANGPDIQGSSILNGSMEAF